MPLFWPLNLLIPIRDSSAPFLYSGTPPPTTTAEFPGFPKPSFLRRFFTRIRGPTPRPTTETSEQLNNVHREPIHPVDGDRTGSENGVTENTSRLNGNLVINTTNGTSRCTSDDEATNSATGSVTQRRSLAAIAQAGTNSLTGKKNSIAETTTCQLGGTESAQNTNNQVLTNTSATHGNRPRLPASWSFRSVRGTTCAPDHLGRAGSYPSMRSARPALEQMTMIDDTLLEEQLHRYDQAQGALSQTLEDLETIIQERDSCATLADNRRKECDAVRLLYVAAEAKVAELSTDYDILDNSYASVKRKYQRTLWEQDEWEADESDATLREQVEVQGEQLRGVAVMLQGVERMLEEWITPGLAVRDPGWYTSPDGSMFVVIRQKIKTTQQELAAGEAANWPAPACSSEESNDELPGSHDAGV